MLAAFDHTEQEADDPGDAYFKRICESPSDGYTDEEMVMAEAAEVAEDISAEHQQTMRRVEQSVLNLAAIAYAHTFEQQLLDFHRRAVANHLSPDEDERDFSEERSTIIKCLQDLGIYVERYSIHPKGEKGGDCWSDFNAAKKCLGSTVVDIETISAWSQVDKLRKVANVAKHGEGPSAEKLRRLWPEMFIDPSIRELLPDPQTGQPSRPLDVRRPLTGEDLYVTRADLESYVEAVLTFWRDLVNRLDSSSP